MISEIERIIGYEFKDKQLLVTAFTHSSYAHENKTASNERLEFLGDGLLGFVIAEILYNTNGDEGMMSVTRASIVSRTPLSRAMIDFDLGKYILFGQSIVVQRHENRKLLSDTFEALVAAVYLDGGIECAKKLITKMLGDNITNALLEKAGASNHKGILQEYVQKYKLGEIVYEVVENLGSAHEPIFKVVVRIGGEVCGVGQGKKRKEAEAIAAKVAVEKLRKS